MKRILLADLDPYNAQVLEMALLGESYHVTRVHTLEEWTSVLETKSFSLILMDESFLEISRELFALSKKAYKKLERTPSIIMTMYPEIMEHRHKFSLKAKFLLKPFQASEMFLMMKQVFFEKKELAI